MKRQHTQAAAIPYHAETSKSTKATHASPFDMCDGNAPGSKEEEQFFSPRKLLEEYDQNDKDEKKPRAKKARTLNYDSASSPNGKQDEKEEESADTSANEEANDELFSPALKLPRVSRSTSTSPPNARTRLESKFAHTTQPEEKIEEEAAEEEESVETEEQDDEDTTAPEQEFNPFYFMKTLPKYEDIVEGKRPISLPEKSRNAPKICLVLDLDETLVHCSVDEVKNPHMQFPVTFNGVEYIVNVKKRPHMEYFLKRVSKLFEIVVFTASHKVYRLYRDDCLDVFGNYLKDLNVLGRDLSKVLLVDNSPHAFGYQVNNGIPIETWYDDEADAELLNLLPFLESLVDVDDVRPIVEKQFQIQKLIDATPDEIYTEACTKLISQYKTAETALRLGGFIDSVESFIAEYRLDCPRALERLVRIGVPATVMHNTTNRKTDSVNVAQTVQNFITLMDVLKLNIRAVDEIQPLLSEMMSSLTMVSGLPPDFAGRDKIEGWLRTMNSMRASEELDEEQARQLSFDLERAYSSFMAFLNK
ncbi:Exocyst complex component 7 [Phytophthora nicotianae]|uniref:Exocyst complex component 7 n=1 Tax=Phytophthora nicotianae TaxID=4792 RepID=A0A0W8D8W4_PHYNI|nr:Exocyst complex component 7 [Phytophthora nicotianae]